MPATATPSSSFNLVRTYALVALVVFGLAGLSLAAVLDGWFEQNVLHLAGERNQALARLVGKELWEDFGATLREGADGVVDAAIRARMQRHIHALTEGTDITGIKVFDTRGRTLIASDEDAIGRIEEGNEEFRLALAGQPVNRFATRDLAYAEREGITGTRLVSSYLPLYGPDGRDVLGVVELHVDAGRLIEEGEATLANIVYAGLGIMLAAYAVLFLLVLRAQRVITAQQEEIIAQATRDHLTGLPDRGTFADNLEQAISRARRLGQQLGLLYIDLDEFKAVNDRYGHQAGDTLLRTVAHRMRGVVRDYNMLARIGGDEFALTVGSPADAVELDALAQRLGEEVGQPVEIGDQHIRITASIGIAVFPADGGDSESLVRAADTAMYRAKQGEGGSARFYNEQIDHRRHTTHELVQALEAALENEHFELYYQPKVDAATGSVVGAEALLRWRDGQRGLVSPAEFIPTLEESGLIVPVGEWVIREACRAQRRWRDAGIEVVPVAVNVSAQQFHQPGFAEGVGAIVDETGIDPRLLEIEMTESCLMEDVESNVMVLNALKEKGFRIAIDDFGTGYSSLSYLKKFPIDTLKIDRSFITDVHKRAETDNAAIVTAIMALSHSLRLSVVAEGVETAHELAYLHALGCRTIQGFLFSQPLEESEYEAMLRDSMILRRTMEAIREELAVGGA